MGCGSFARRVAESLASAGVSHVFGVPAAPTLPYLEAWSAAGVGFVQTSHESSAGFMAGVAARLTGRVGACYGTYGPGAVNLASGVGSAWLDRCPVLALTSEHHLAAAGRITQMGLDHHGLFEPLTKGTLRLTRGGVERELSAAASLAAAEIPGPVHVGLPAQLDRDYPSVPLSSVSGQNSFSNEPTASALGRAVDLWVRAKRPVVVLGLTAVRLGLGRLAVAVAESRGAPVVVTPMAKGAVPPDHPLAVGVLFHALADRVAEVYRQADLVLAVGYDPVEFNYEDWLPDAPLIHMDNRPADVESEPAGGLVNLIGDPAGTLRRLAAEPPRLSAWGAADLARHRDALAEALTAPPGSFGPRAVLAALRDALPENGILTCDVGAHTHLIGQAWSANHPDELIMTNGWSSMGFGLPAAVAAKICRPDRPVAAVIGDGGFLMSAGELAAAARLKLGLVVVVLVDHGLSLIRVKQRRSGCEDRAVEGWPAGGLTGDRLFGAQLETARNLDELRGALQGGWNHQRPCVIQVFVDGREYHRLIARSHK